MAREISNSDNLIDSRDVIERIAELDAMGGREEWEEDELTALRALAEDGYNEASEWSAGATLVRESYFTDYAEQTAYDLGMVSREAAESWPVNLIDWDEAADQLKIDYNTVNFDGVTYYVR